MNKASLALDAPTLPRPARIVLTMLSRLERGSLRLLLPDGRRLDFRGGPGRDAHWRVNDWRVFEDVLAAGDIGFARGYIDGRWSSDDPAALVELALANEDCLARAVRGNVLTVALYRLRHLWRDNSRGGSRRNIAAHYDLGNDFYALWLDPGMSYSAALFDGDRQCSLEAAQTAKQRRILRRLRIAPGDRVLELGCGWGGFAIHAARHAGCTVDGITLSQRQLDWARAAVQEAGLDERVKLSLTDYRDLRGQWDKVVSVEMFEAVGERHWPRYFRCLRDSLVPGGRALVQTITIADERFERYRRGTDFIQQYVFPGGMLPSVGAFAAGARRAGLEVEEVFRFGACYAETLARWRAEFDRREEAVARLGFDANFRRLWRFYLAYCEAAFRAGSTDVAQIVLRRP